MRDICLLTLALTSNEEEAVRFFHVCHYRCARRAVAILRRFARFCTRARARASSGAAARAPEKRTGIGKLKLKTVIQQINKHNCFQKKKSCFLHDLTWRGMEWNGTMWQGTAGSDDEFDTTCPESAVVTAFPHPPTHPSSLRSCSRNGERNGLCESETTGKKHLAFFPQSNNSFLKRYINNNIFDPFIP